MPRRVYRSRVWIGIDFALKGVEVSVIFFETHLNRSVRETGVNFVGVTEAVLLGILIASSEGGHVQPFFFGGLNVPSRGAGREYL